MVSIISKYTEALQRRMGHRSLNKYIPQKLEIQEQGVNEASSSLLGIEADREAQIPFCFVCHSISHLDFLPLAYSKAGRWRQPAMGSKH